MSVSIFATYMRKRRRSSVQTIVSHFQAVEQQIPVVLVCAMNNLIDADNQLTYADANRAYNEHWNDLAKLTIADLPAGSLRHHSIHCISFRDCLSSVIGMDITGFGRLVQSLKEPLRRAFPRCPERLEKDEIHRFSERRFKLFLCLFRLKQGTTFKCMEVLFGWSSSVLQEWFDIVLHILVHHLECFHEGFLTYKGANWQRTELLKWHAKHHALGNIESYHRKIEYQNNESDSGDTINAESFVGSIGAIDGTYSVQPRVGKATLLAHGDDPSLDLMYTEYKRCHAYKLLIVTSHGIGESSKFILWLGSGCGSASDANVYLTFSHTLLALLVKEAAMLGDHAFHSQPGIIAPYTSSQIRSHVGFDLSSFNSDHSSDRMTSEHGVRYMKMWGIVRGRDDSQLFQNEKYFKLALKAVWGLHNYIHSNCPVLKIE